MIIAGAARATQPSPDARVPDRVLDRSAARSRFRLTPYTPRDCHSLSPVAGFAGGR